MAGTRPTISPLPPAPQRSAPGNFPALADQWVSAMQPMTDQINAVAAWLDERAAEAEQVIPAAYSATSTTTLTVVDSGDITLTLTEPDRIFAPGMSVVIADSVQPNIVRMTGTVLSYDRDTSQMTVRISTGDSVGTQSSSWTISVAVSGEPATIGGMTPAELIASSNLALYMLLGGAI